MNVTSTLININSANPQALYEWYRDVLGLPVQEGMGETAVQAGGVAITFDGHSEISGPAKEPARYLVNFFVDDAAAETERIEKAGVSCIRRLGQEFWGGIISTFVDPDGNYVQVIEYREPQA
ncbi:MAG: VOC family protein [Dehalococcoidia bacterium]